MRWPIIEKARHAGPFSFRRTGPAGTCQLAEYLAMKLRTFGYTWVRQRLPL
jgi:hypothetical protein